jgi:hypothetical protein
MAALRITSPRNGATVREKVRVTVPRSAVPGSGFVALYVDGRFVAAQSPPRGANQPVSLVWNTKEKLAETAGAEKAEIRDGRHTLEVRTYSNAGDIDERAQISVIVDNNLEVRKGQPVSLAYRFRVGDTTPYNHRVEIEATPTSGAGAAAPGTTAQLKLVENATFKVFVEDVLSGEAFMREKRNSPVIVAVNEQRQPVPVDVSSRYYEMDAVGNVARTKAMERERRQAIVNVIRLPGRSVKVGETWRGPLRIALGNFVPEQLVANATNKLEGIVWSNGRPAARIVSSYEGNVKLSLVNLGVPTGDYKYKGKSTILFAPSLGKVLSANHELEGDLTIDLLQQQYNQTGPNSSGGFAPSLGGYGGAPGGGYGVSFGPPGASGPGGPPGGVPGGYPGGYGAPGASGPGGPPGGAPGGYPGGYGAPGGYPGGYGSPGGYDPSGYGGSTAPQTTQTYKTNINVTLAVPA